MKSDNYSISIVKRETTDDGDVCFTYEVRAKGFDGIRSFNETRKYPITTWTGCGESVFKATFRKVVDGAVIAIEESNDRWVSASE